MHTHSLCGSGTTQATDDSVREPGLLRTGTEFLPRLLNPRLLDVDYGHSATALLGIVALGFLLAFPTWLF
jgi:hypothetical protein